MTIETRAVEAQPLTTADRQQAVTDSLRQIARVSRFVDRKKGIRSYHDQGKSDPWIPVLFALFFVLPTLAGAVYYGLIASKRYVTEASFAVRPALGMSEGGGSDSSGSSSSSSSGGSSPAAQLISQDISVTEEYVLSRPMIEAVEAQLPIREWFGRDSIDYLSRFDPEKPIEKFVKYWGRRVDVSVEKQSNIVLLSVEAFDPGESLAIARAIMTEAERKVNAGTDAMRATAVAESEREVRLVEERMIRNRVETRDLRNRDGILDAEKTNDTNLKAISEMRAARINLSVQLAIGQRDLGPEARRIIDIKQQIRDLDDNIARIERTSASQDPEQKRLLSDALTRFEALENERKTAQKRYEAVLTAYERARIVASRQMEFFTPIVQPVEARSSTQPRRLLMTGLIAAGSALLFAAAVFARKLTA